jgi:hypothetical protein
LETKAQPASLNEIDTFSFLTNANTLSGSVAKELNRPSGARRFQKHNATFIASITTATALSTEHRLCGADVLQVPLAGPGLLAWHPMG